MNQPVPGTGADWHWGVIAGHIVKIRQARQEPQGSPDRLEYRFSPEAGPGYFESLFQSYFRLDDDIDSIYREITRDPRVAAMVRRYIGPTAPPPGALGVPCFLHMLR